jgi:DNA uptake protein ComE-like DNA-binding protein
MTRPAAQPLSAPRRGSVLIIVMWVCLGLVALALYFANSMNSEMRAAANRVNEIASRQAIAGATRYAAYVLKEHAIGGAIPDIDDYRSNAVPLGDAYFWFIGRATDPQQAIRQTQIQNEPFYALVAENSKLNLNTVTSAMLQALPLPNMTPEFADAIVAWRTANSQNAINQDNFLSQLDPPRHNKGAPFESVDELRLVNGAMLDLVLGEDTNRNGVLESNEDDGEISAPRDDQDGQLLAGLFEYVTVYSSQPNTTPTGATRLNVTTLNTQQGRQQLIQRLTQVGIAQQRATQIAQQIPIIQNPNPAQPAAGALTSVADFMVTSQMTPDEFALIHAELTHTTGAAPGLVNVNVASEAVLACIPGIGPDRAASVVAYRSAHPEELTSMAWLTSAGMSAANIRQAGTYITDQSYQFSADIAAVGSNGRGYCREKVIFDTSTGTPRIVYRQDLTSYGWALGATTRRILSGLNDT